MRNMDPLLPLAHSDNIGKFRHPRHQILPEFILLGFIQVQHPAPAVAKKQIRSPAVSVWSNYRVGIIEEHILMVASHRMKPRLMQQPQTTHRVWPPIRSEEHTPELQSLMRISYHVYCLKKK